jgi:hypothetical protein
VRVIGNHAVHPGQIDLNDTPGVAAALFTLVNLIVHARISQPKESDVLSASLPDAAKEAIARRDALT